MLFNSFHFLVFFPVVTLGYFLAPQWLRAPWLLLASCWFYMAFVPKYILILALTIAVDYIAGIMIERSQGVQRRLFLILSIVANCGVLAWFKYYNFANANIAALARALHWNYSVQALTWILPIGLSFHTFQSMAYTIEVYRGNIAAEKRLGILAVYVMFYPQLVAGPIERPQNLLHQFDEVHKFDYKRVADGLKLMAWGFFKKVVIADRLAVSVNEIYDHPAAHPGSLLLVATYLFAFQILCDFSGYSDIAQGSAQVMGFRLMTNFRQPYLSQSVTEFWGRWHISLYTWFRDYLFLPLESVQWWRGASIDVNLAMNVMIVFLISGLWHGANWTYVVWGGLNGAYIAAEILMPRWLKTPVWLRRFITFNLICVTWVFFRAPTVGSAFYILKRIAASWRAPQLGALASLGAVRLVLIVFLIALLETVHRIQSRRSVRDLISAQPVWLRWSVYFAGLAVILAFGEYEGTQRFIYFQF